MAVRQTGCAMLVENNVQQVMDLSAVAHGGDRRADPVYQLLRRLSHLARNTED